MMSEYESMRMSGDDFGSLRLRRDIEEISKALCLHDTSQRALISPTIHQPMSMGEIQSTKRKSKYVSEYVSLHAKKSSIWKWKPLKALTHIRNHRLNCYFFLHVHSIEGLPLNFNGLGLCVYWKRKHEVLKSHCLHVQEGMVEFEETLVHRCSVYVSKSGPHDDVAKYEPKLSLFYTSVVGAPDLDLGKQWIDLTRLLPLTLTELEEENNHHGKWTTSFKLMGKAKGATINVSFGFSLSENNFLGSSNLRKIPNLLKGSGASRNSMVWRLGSIPSFSRSSRMPSPYVGSSISILYQLLDEAKLSSSKELKLGHCDLRSKSSHEIDVCEMGYDKDDVEFRVIDEGIEFPMTDQLTIEEGGGKDFENTTIETIDVAKMFEDDEAALNEEIGCKVNEVCGVDDVSSKENVIESTIEELENFFHDLSISESAELDFSFQKNECFDQDYHMDTPSFEGGKMIRSHSLDNFSESIVSDFMSLLGSDSEPDSPRGRLLKEFEKETIHSGNSLFDFNDEEDQRDHSIISDSSFVFEGAEMERDHGAIPLLIRRRKAKQLENLETESLMQEWGLNERAFENSPQTLSGAFGSPVYLSPQRPPELPPLREGLGSFLKTKNGGLVRSMNPSLFTSAKNGERLIMQASSSVVLPAAMGFNGMDILQKWATVGAEKMLSQASQLMPLEEITGKTLQHASWEAEFEFEMAVLERGAELVRESGLNDNLHMKNEEAKEMGSKIDSDYVSLGNIAHFATEKIQCLLIEGLRIQSGMSNEEPTSSIRVQSLVETSASTSNRVEEGSSSNFRGNLNEFDELIGMSIPLEEWIRLDSASFDDKCEVGDPISKAFAAHGAKTDLSPVDKFGKFSDENRGCFGNNFTLSLRVLLRDPFRDYEPIGVPMLVLIQVERTYDSGYPIFQIIDVHITGFKADPGKKQQSGLRWLQSSGMTGKTKRHPLSQSNALVRSSSQLINNGKHEDILWSISSYVYGAVARTLYVRNPDIIFK